MPLSRSGPAMPEVPVVSRNMITYLISLLSAVPFYRSLDPSVISRTNKFFAVCLATMADASDQDLSAYLPRRATRWYRRFFPVESPDCADENSEGLRPRIKEGAEGQEGADSPQSQRLLKRGPLRCPTMIRTRNHEMKPDFHSFFM